MSGSVARSLVEKIQTDLQAITAGATYTYTLSDDTARVMIADPDDHPPESPPRVYIRDYTPSTRPDDEMGSFRRILTVEIIGFVAAEGDDPGTRGLCALDLLNDIAIALETDRGLTDGAGAVRVVEMKLEAQAIDGQKIGHPGYGICEIIATYEYIAPSARGF